MTHRPILRVRAYAVYTAQSKPSSNTAMYNALRCISFQENVCRWRGLLKHVKSGVEQVKELPAAIEFILTRWGQTKSVDENLSRSISGWMACRIFTLLTTNQALKSQFHAQFHRCRDKTCCPAHHEQYWTSDSRRLSRASRWLLKQIRSEKNVWGSQNICGTIKAINCCLWLPRERQCKQM
jgi:hypothetical protein